MNSRLPKCPGLAALCLFATALSGCHDSSADPLAVILTEETRSVLAAEASLPSLPRLVETAGAEQLDDAAELWAGSWDLPLEEGREVRSRLSTESAAPLARAIGHTGVSSAVRSVGETLHAATAIRSQSITDGIAENLERAQLEHAEAASALAAGRDDEALGSALEAADLIREVGPESVTRLLLARAEERLEVLEGRSGERRTPGVIETMAAAALGEAADGADDAVHPDEAQIDLERGRRLIRGARLALDEGDFVRAIQRAYYACQVLGLDPN